MLDCDIAIDLVARQFGGLVVWHEQLLAKEGKGKFIYCVSFNVTPLSGWWHGQ